MAGPKPHVGGPVVAPCEPTVLIGGLPAARVGDRLTCIGDGQDVVAEGATTVLIGGKPAARIGDKTSHGGVIVKGCHSVLIGDGSGDEDEDADGDDEDGADDGANDSSDDNSSDQTADDGSGDEGSDESSDDGSSDQSSDEGSTDDGTNGEGSDDSSSDQSPGDGAQQEAPQEEALKATAYTLDNAPPPPTDPSFLNDPDPDLTGVPADPSAPADLPSTPSSTTLSGEVSAQGQGADGLDGNLGGGLGGDPNGGLGGPDLGTGASGGTPDGGAPGPDSQPSLGGDPAPTRLLKASAVVNVERAPGPLQAGVQEASQDVILQRLGQGILDGLQKGMEEIANKDAAKLTGSANAYAQDKLVSPDTLDKALENFGKNIPEALKGPASTLFKAIDITKEYRENLDEIAQRDAALKAYVSQNDHVDPYVLGDSFGHDMANAYKGTLGIFTGLQAPNKGTAETAAAELGAQRTEQVEKAAADAAAHVAAARASQTLEGDPVNVATGEVVDGRTDFTLPGPLPLVWSRAWTSRSPINGELGFGWHHSFDLILRPLPDGGGYGARLADGRIALLPAPAQGAPAVDVRERLILEAAGEGFILTSYEGLAHHFGPRSADGSHRLIGVADVNGNAVTLDRDPDGGLRGLLDSAGRRIKVERDARGRITALIGPHPDAPGQTRVLAAYAYDDAGNLVEARGPGGHPFRYAYENHLIVGTRWPAGLEFRFAWDDVGLGRRARCIETVGSGGLHRVSLAYDEAARTTAVRRANGGEVRYVWNDQGLVTAETDPVGGRTVREWSPEGRLLRHVDPAGQWSTYRYDALGRLVEINDGARGASSIAYASSAPGPTPLDRISRLVSPEGNVHEWSYDERGNVSAYKDPTQRERRTIRDGRGLPLSIADAAGVYARFAWSTQGELIARGSQRTIRARYDHDALGRVVGLRRGEDPPMRLTLDAEGLVVEILRGDGARTSLGYNPEGRLVLHRNATGAETRWRYDGLPVPVERQDADGSVVRYAYDLELNLVGVQNQKGEWHRLLYDPAGRVVAEKGVDGRELAYRYDALGHLVEQTDAGVIIAYQRDPQGRLIEKRFPDGGRHRFAWSPDGALILAENDEARVEFRYDACGRLTAEIRDDMALTHGYDARGRRTETMLPDGRALTLGYTHEDGVEDVRFDGALVARFTYDRLGREIQREAGGLVGRQTHDLAGRLINQSGVRAADGVTAYVRAYAYDLGDQLVGVTDMVRGSKTFRYDVCDRLLEVGGSDPEHFVADPAQNVLPASQAGVALAAVKADRLLFYGPRRYSYDDRGNRTAETTSEASGAGRLYRYDADNQLLGVEEAVPQGLSRTSFGYDALGRRLWKRHHVEVDQEGAAAHTQEVRTDFFWDGDLLLAETQDASDPLSVVYLFEPSSFRPLAQVRRDAVGTGHGILTYHLDQLGTPQEITNGAGVTVWAGELSAFGSLKRAFTDEIANPWRFLGQYHDEETGLSYSRHRYYAPAEGRFIQQDPIRLAAGINFSAYAPNPIQWADPLGLAFQNVAGGKLGVNMGEYSFGNPGPLPLDVAGNFRGGRYTAVQLQQDTTLYRAGASDRDLGEYFTTTPPASVVQARMDSAVLPVWPGGKTSTLDTAYTVVIPKGTTVYQGTAGYMRGFYAGGTDQVMVPKPWTIPGVDVVGSTPLK